MNLQSNDKMYGVTEGVYYGQQERVDEINDRMKERVYPDSPLQPNFSPRPIPTKYSVFPIVNRRTPSKATYIPYPDYNSEINFNPGNSSAPVSGYINNIDVETILRNQTTCLQHGAEQGVYIPTTNSDLYNVSVVSKPSNQPCPLLFETYEFNQSPNPNVLNSTIGRDQFFNHTRTQLRNA